jgi:hypothetical protein
LPLGSGSHHSTLDSVFETFALENWGIGRQRGEFDILLSRPFMESGVERRKRDLGRTGKVVGGRNLASRAVRVAVIIGENERIPLLEIHLIMISLFSG